MRMHRAALMDVDILANLAVRMWTEHTVEELSVEFAEIMESQEAAFFIAYEREEAVGFAQCQLRHDYVEGTDSSPVGYLEGIYVADGYRHKGLAKKLLSECEKWALEMSCVEFASDCELTNEASLCFHLRAGFTEANRIICFTKHI